MSGALAPRLLEAIAQTAGVLPVGHVESLAAAIAAAPRFDQDVVGRAMAAVASPPYRYHARALLEVWSTTPKTSGPALALQAGARARERAQTEQVVEAVWTGPTTQAVPVRKTREVLLELIRLARARLTVVSFAAYRVPEVLAALSEASGRGVTVRLVLESSEASQARLTHDAAATFASLDRAVEFYVWPADRRMADDGAVGVLHAKAVIADTRAAFVTSANLTGNALGANMELGLLVQGGTVPARLQAHFDELIAQGVLRRVT